MSFLFGSPKAAPAPEPKTGGLEQENISSNEQGVPVRYFAGVRRLVVDWMGKAYRVRTVPVTSGSDGKFSKKQHTGDKYYADVMGLVCMGPVDGIKAIFVDAELVWSGNVGRDGPGGPTEHKCTITIEGRGVMTLYWGTADQPIDSLLSGGGHPAYRHQCYAVFNQLYLGENQQNAPNVELVLYRKPATSLSGTADFDLDAVPAFAAAELLENKLFGLGWDLSERLKASQWSTAAGQMLTEELACSPLLDQADEGRTVVQGLLDYAEAFILPDPADNGRLELKLARPFAGNPATLPLIGEYDLLELPEFDLQPWRETSNEIQVRFTDRDKWLFKGDAEPWRDLANRAIVGEVRPLSIDRPFLTIRKSAVKAAAYAGRLQSVPWVEGTLVCRLDTAGGLRAGDFFRFTYTHYVETLIMRVIEAKLPDGDGTTIELKVRCDGYQAYSLPFLADLPDRARSPNPDTPTDDPDEGEDPSAPVSLRHLEVPRGLLPSDFDATKPHVATLVGRATYYDVRADVHLSGDGGTTYHEVANVTRFAWTGTLVDAVGISDSRIFDDGADGLLIDLNSIDPPSSLPSTNEAGRQLAELLVFIGGEIMSYKTATPTGPAQVRLTGLRRACFSSLRTTHAVGADLAIMRRSELPIWTDELLEFGREVYLKTAIGTLRSGEDLSDVTPTTMTIANRTARPFFPFGLAIAGNGLSGRYSSGGSCVINWLLTSWNRRRLTASFAAPYRDPAVEHVIIIEGLTAGDVKREVVLPAGVGRWDYTAAMRSADFGSEPDEFYVKMFARQAGYASTGGTLFTAVRAGHTPVALIFKGWLTPSGLMSVMGLANPLLVITRNVQLCAAYLGLTIAPIRTVADLADAFEDICDTRCTWLNVATAADPEAATQWNFEQINKWIADVSGFTIDFASSDPGTSYSAAGTFWIDTSAEPHVVKKKDSGGSWVTQGQVDNPDYDADPYQGANSSTGGSSGEAGAGGGGSFIPPGNAGYGAGARDRGGLNLIQEP